MEISPDKYHEIMTLAVYLGDGFTFVISGVFTMYTRDVYLFLQLLSITTIVSVVILGLYLPESPRYLYSSRNYDGLY
jgi:1,4-dihydroxy-2-naphthoate octaprenyltransferase